MKAIKLLSAAILLSFSYNTFADDVCPPADVVRYEGGTFVTGYAAELDGTKIWRLFSKAFDWNGTEWQTAFVFKHDAKLPAQAIEIGQEMFDKSPLSTKPEQATGGDQIVCIYNPSGAQYTVAAISPVEYGFKK